MLEYFQWLTPHKRRLIRKSSQKMRVGDLDLKAFSSNQEL